MATDTLLILSFCAATRGEDIDMEYYILFCFGVALRWVAALMGPAAYPTVTVWVKCKRYMHLVSTGCENALCRIAQLLFPSTMTGVRNMHRRYSPGVGSCSRRPN